MSFYHPEQIIEAIEYLRKNKNDTKLSNEALKDIYLKLIIPLSDIYYNEIEDKNINEILELFETKNWNCCSYDKLLEILHGELYHPPFRTYLSNIIENVISIETLKKELPNYYIHKLFFTQIHL